MVTQIKENAFGQWRIMWREDEIRFQYKDFSTKLEAQNFERILIKSNKK